MMIARMTGAIVLSVSVLSGCGTVREKTAPCKRPASLASFAADPQTDCQAMRAINDPATAFAAIGIAETRSR